MTTCLQGDESCLLDLSTAKLQPDQWHSIIFFYASVTVVIWPYGHLYWDDVLLWHMKIIAREFRYCLTATYVDWSCHSVISLLYLKCHSSQVPVCDIFEGKIAFFCPFRMEFYFSPNMFQDVLNMSNSIGIIIIRMIPIQFFLFCILGIIFCSQVIIACHFHSTFPLQRNCNSKKEFSTKRFNFHSNNIKNK